MKHLLRIALVTLTLGCWLHGFNVHAGGTVTAATEADLRAALVGGGTVTFAVDGTITLTSRLIITNNTVIDGTGHAVTLSGGGAVGVLLVNSGVKLTLSRLTIAN